MSSFPTPSQVSAVRGILKPPHGRHAPNSTLNIRPNLNWGGNQVKEIEIVGLHNPTPPQTDDSKGFQEYRKKRSVLQYMLVQDRLYHRRALSRIDIAVPTEMKEESDRRNQARRNAIIAQCNMAPNVAHAICALVVDKTPFDARIDAHLTLATHHDAVPERAYYTNLDVQLIRVPQTIGSGPASDLHKLTDAIADMDLKELLARAQETLQSVSVVGVQVPDYQERLFPEGKGQVLLAELRAIQKQMGLRRSARIIELKAGQDRKAGRG